MTVTFQAVLYFHALQVARLAANEGLMATQGLSGSTSAGQRRAADVLDQFGRPLTAAEVDVNRSAQTARVVISGRVPMLVPGFRIPVEAIANGPVSSFRR